MDVTTAQAHLDAWMAADLAVSKGQSYSVGNRSLSRSDAETIRRQIDYWQRIVNTLTTRNAATSGELAYTNPGVARASWS